MNGYRWAPSSLYNIEGHDIEATVIQMLRHATPNTTILKMLKNLRENGAVTESTHTSLQKFVLQNTGAIFDVGPTYGRPNQSLVLSHASLRPTIKTSKACVEAQLDMLLQKLQKIWDPTSNTYRHYSDVHPPRGMPSQYLAFLELRYRLESGLPVLVCIAAPAGFGKTELVSSLLHYLVSKNIHWECIAVTGVAASQIVGGTVHSLIQASAEGDSALFNNVEKKAEFEKIQGFIFDEAMMAEEEIVFKLIERCQQIPLQEALRRRTASLYSGIEIYFFVATSGNSLQRLENVPSGALDAFGHISKYSYLKKIVDMSVILNCVKLKSYLHGVVFSLTNC